MRVMLAVAALVLLFGPERARGAVPRRRGLPVRLGVADQRSAGRRRGPRSHAAGRGPGRRPLGRGHADDERRCGSHPTGAVQGAVGAGTLKGISRARR